MGHRYELPIVSFLAVILVLLPLPWHWKARNVATLSLIGWLVVCNLVRGINSIIWMDNVIIHYRVWCDIGTKLIVGSTVALPACSFCITRHLEHVASARYAVATAADKRRRRIIDLCITIGIPVIMMAIHYVVQGHRFDILEDFGCQPVTYQSIAGLIVIYGTPMLLSVASLVLAALALRHFAIRRLEFEQHLKDSRSALTTARYMRLMALALSEMLWGTSLGSWMIFDNVRRTGLRPWISWDAVHYNFSRVAIFPEFLITDMPQVLLSWFILPCTAFLFFIFFGFSDEAREGYVNAWRWTRRTVFRRKDDSSLNSSVSKNTLPQFRSDQRTRRLGSFSSPDDIDLDFPDLDKHTGASFYSAPPLYTRGDASDMGYTTKAEADTASAISLTLPDIACDTTLAAATAVPKEDTADAELTLPVLQSEPDLEISTSHGIYVHTVHDSR